MKATELRIGNIVQYLCKDELDERKEWYEPNIIDWNDLKVLSEREKRLLKLPPPNKVVKPDYIPISLTEDIFIKHGFTKDTTNSTIWIDIQTHYLEFREADGYFYPRYCQYGELSSESEQCVAMNRISSLHELQNLFYALTGKELEINL